MASPNPPDDPDVLCARATLLARLGDHEQAVPLFRRAAERGCRTAWSGLAAGLAGLGRWDEAVEVLQDAAAAGAEDAWLDLAAALLQLGRWSDAERAALRAVDAGDPRAWGPLGTALLEQGARPAAMLAFGRAAELGTRGGVEGAHLLRDAGREAEARAWAQRAADAGDAESAAVLACWDWAGSRDPALEEDLREGAAHHPPARACLADLLRSGGRVEEARSVLEAGALRGELDSWLPLGNLYLDELGDDRAAEAAYRAGIEGGDLFSHTNLGLLLRDRGDRSGALEHLAIAAAGGDDLAAAELRDLRDDGWPPVTTDR